MALNTAPGLKLLYLTFPFFFENLIQLKKAPSTMKYSAVPSVRASTKSFEGFLQVGFSAHILTVSHSVHLGHFKFGAKKLGAKKGLWAQLDVLCTLRGCYTRVTLGILTWGPRFGPVQPLPLLVTCRW